jgi:hypothetical protein
MSVYYHHKHNTVNSNKEGILAVLDKEESYIPSRLWT